MPSPARPPNAPSRWPLLLAALALLSFFPYLPQLRSPNELCRLHQSRAIVDDHSIAINAVLEREGWVGDLSCVATARGEGGEVLARRDCPSADRDPSFPRPFERRYYSSKAPLLSFAAAPLYALLKVLYGGAHVPELALVLVARLFITILPTLLLLVLLRRFLRDALATHGDEGTEGAGGIPRERAIDALTLLYALGTLAFSYSELFMSHQSSAVLLFLAFYAAFRAGRREWPRWGYPLAGLFAGLTVACEYTAALGLIPIAFYALMTAPGGARGKVRATAQALAGVAPIALALALYHQAAFGAPLDSGYKYLNDAGYQGWHQGGFLGVRLPTLRAFTLSLFSPLRGLFVLSPFLALALCGFAPANLRRGARARGELLLCFAVLALYLYFTSSFTYDSWGWTTGPRHLTPLIPFLMLPALLFLTRSPLSRTAPLAGLAAGLALASIAVTSVMTWVDYIPDGLHNGLFELALPLALKGYLPHSPLSLLGVANPWAALPGLLAIAAALLYCAVLLRPARKSALYALCTAATLALFVGSLSLARPRGEARARGERTLRFMEEHYLPRPGEASPGLRGSDSRDETRGRR